MSATSITRGRWIDHWEPENEQFWQSTGRAIARKNLIFSIFAENLGFSVWVLWTIIVINLGNVGYELTLRPEQLTAAQFVELSRKLRQLGFPQQDALP